jgi:putative Holliday junction resolvase
MAGQDGTILALDIGAARIGLALSSRTARIASPYKTIANTADSVQQLATICEQEDVKEIVVGLPRGMSGQETAQTVAVRTYGDRLAAVLAVPLVWQDETLTSVKAEEELTRRGKPYRKEDIDALAATYILEDYLHENV